MRVKGPSLSLLHLYRNMTRLSPLIVTLSLTAGSLKDSVVLPNLSPQTLAVIWFRRVLWVVVPLQRVFVMQGLMCCLGSNPAEAVGAQPRPTSRTCSTAGHFPYKAFISMSWLKKEKKKQTWTLYRINITPQPNPKHSNVSWEERYMSKIKQCSISSPLH